MIVCLKPNIWSDLLEPSHVVHCAMKIFREHKQSLNNFSRTESPTSNKKEVSLMMLLHENISTAARAMRNEVKISWRLS